MTAAARLVADLLVGTLAVIGATELSDHHDPTTPTEATP